MRRVPPKASRAQRVLAIDPSSGVASPVGYAEFVDGKLIRSGVIEVPKGNASERLFYIRAYLQVYFETPDVLVVEDIPRVRILKPVLTQSVGAILSAFPAPELVEIPPRTWKAFIKANPGPTEGYFKSDEWDARILGLTYLAGAHRIKVPKRKGRKKRTRKKKPGGLIRNG